MTMIQLYDGDAAYAFTWGVLSDPDVARAMRRVLSHRLTHIIMHNLSHDRKVLRHHMGLEFDERDEDTMVWGLGLTERGNQVGLKYLSRQYLNAPFYEEDLKKWFDPDNDPWDMCPPSVLAEYGCADVYNTYQLRPILTKLVAKEGTTELCNNLLLPAARTFADCEYRGIGVDTQYAKELEEQWIPMVDEAERKIKEYARLHGFPSDPAVCASQTIPLICPQCSSTNATVVAAMSELERGEWRKTFEEVTGTDSPCNKCMRRRYLMVPDLNINVRSFKHLAHLAYDILGFEEGKFGRTTDKKFFERNEGHEFVELIQNFRQLDKLLNSFVRAIMKHVREDGRIHPNFLLFGAVTGRLSIKDPAMQTIPKFGTNPVLAKMIRRLFPARPGYVILDVDYANLELFTCWAYSEDEELGKALTEQDYHTTVASAVTGKPYDEITPEERNSFKPLTFGISYGMTAWKMAQGPLKEVSGGSEDVWQRYIDDMWAKFPKWKQTYDKWISDALETGELTSMIGRKRRWKLINQSNEWHVRNQASNFPSQSLASDLCVNSLIKLNKLLPERGYGNVLFPVHDSIVAEVRKDKIHEAVRLIEETMTTPPFDSVAQFRVKVEVGPTLGDVDVYDPEKSYV
jgi:DNA polymerase I-like protein with 3'-5' exonuclease and polymerase domains